MDENLNVDIAVEDIPVEEAVEVVAENGSIRKLGIAGGVAGVIVLGAIAWKKFGKPRFDQAKLNWATKVVEQNKLSEDADDDAASKDSFEIK